MHGHGKHNPQTANAALAQHPHIMAFHQAPKSTAETPLLVLIEVEVATAGLPCTDARESDSLRHLQIAGLICRS
ncbi:hypothetical protein DMH17_16365 [Raoultella planticola]|nr:hypothetical protein [Raoultella planticola]